jgi:SAM-dependent methyltransferase
MNVKYVAKRFLRRRLPDSWAFALLNSLGRGNPAETLPDWAWTHLENRLGQEGIGVAGKHVLEVGSGRYSRLALRMLHEGAARVTLVDPVAVDLNEDKHRSLLLEDCVKLGFDWDEVLTRVQVLREDLTTLPLPPVEARPDLVVSSAVLEHSHDPQVVLATCWAWLKPGGQTSHMIDLRDHVFEAPLEMLTFSEEVWQRWLCPKRGFHLNRWRLPNYLDAMHEVGFVKVRYRATQRDEAGLETIMLRLDRQFKDMDPGMLSVLMVDLYGEKPR